MKAKLLLIGMFVMISQFSRGQSGNTQSNKLPKDLNDAMDYVNNNWNFIERHNFKSASESDAVASVYFTTGLWIRNDWIHGDRDPALVRYFNSIGVFAPDDISSIILVSLHRKLNNRPINLKKQVDACISYWKMMEDCIKKVTVSAVKNYERFKVGDAITILMYIDTANRSAETFDCPTTDWKFDAKKDLKIDGIVVNKYFINSDSNVFFKVRINRINFNNIEILGNAVRIGAVVNFSLMHLTIQ